MRELIDFDPDTGERLYLQKDADGYFLRQEHDVSAVIEANKTDLNSGEFDKSKDMWHAARVPVGIQYEWLHKYGVNFWDPNHKPAVMRLLNDPEYRYLRVNKFLI